MQLTKLKLFMCVTALVALLFEASGRIQSFGGAAASFDERWSLVLLITAIPALTLYIFRITRT